MMCLGASLCVSVRRGASQWVSVRLGAFWCVVVYRFVAVGQGAACKLSGCWLVQEGHGLPLLSSSGDSVVYMC